jgi:hypothetical protein
MTTEEYQAECPVCLSWFHATGPDGLFPHVLSDHPASPLAQQVDGLILRAILEDGIDASATRRTPAKWADGPTVWDFP